MAARKLSRLASTADKSEFTPLDQIESIQESLKRLERQVYAREAALRTALKAATRALTHYADEVDGGEDYDPKLARWALTVASRGHSASGRAHAQHQDITLALEQLGRDLADIKFSLKNRG